MLLRPPFRMLALPVIIASILSGCGGSDDSDTLVDDPSSDPSLNTGTFKLCHDSTLDGLCGSNENTQSFDSLLAAQAASVNAGGGPVIIRGDEVLLTAPSGADNASLWSTLLYNEGFVNPETGTDATLIGVYLQEKLGLEKNSQLSATEQEAFLASLGSALQTYPEANPYALIGALIDAAVAQGSLQGAVPESSQIETQKVMARTFDTAPESTIKASWETSDNDERVQQIVVANNRVLLVNRWNNRIAVIDASTTEQVVETQPFAALYTAGHHEYSTEADYISGASEHTISQSWLADDGDTLYALVSGPSEVDVPEDDSYGLFRVPLSDGQVPSFMVDSIDGTRQLNVPHRAPSVTRVASSSLVNAIQLDSGHVLAYDNEAGYVRFYSANLSEDTSQAFPLDRSLLGWAVTNDGETLVTLQGPLEGEDATLVQAYSTEDLSTQSSLVMPAGADTLLSSANGNRLLVLQDDTLHVIDSTEMSVTSSLTLSDSLSSTSVLSADGSRAALVFGGEITILNLAEAYPYTEGSIAYDGNLRALAFNGHDEILYSSSGGELSSVSLSALASSPLSVEAQLLEALNSIDEESINHGYDLDAVIHALNMPSSYGAVDLTWDSVNGYITTDGSALQGAVSQAEIGEASHNDTVSVSGAYRFRGDSQRSDTESFDITIRPKSEIREQTVSPLEGVLSGRPIALLTANADGSRVAAWFSSTDDEQAGGLVIFSVGTDRRVTSDSATPVPLPTEYAESTVRGLIYSGQNIHVIIAEAQATAEQEADGRGRILSYNGSTWSQDVQLDGIVRNQGVQLSSDNSKVSIAQDTTPEDADTGTTIVSVFDTSTLADVSTIYTDQDATGTRYPVLAVSNDGQKLMGYTRNDDRQLHYYNSETAIDAAPKALASYDIESTTFGVAYDDAIDAFIAADNDAEVKIFSVASSGEWSSPTLFETSRGAWNGIESVNGGGRMYDANVANGKVYLWSRYLGITAIDLTDPTNPKEAFWAPLESLARYASAISGDGSLLFSHAYDEDNSYSAIAVVPAQ